VAIGDDIRKSTGAACSAFGRLELCLWNEREVRLSTNVEVYQIVVIDNLPPCCMAARHGPRTASCTQSQPVLCALLAMPCKDQVARKKYPKYPARNIWRWSIYHQNATPMGWPFPQTSKTISYAELQLGSRPHGGPLQSEKDNLNTYMQSTGIDSGTW